METLLIKTHELWPETLMVGFMSQTKNRTKLYDFADIIFRRFTWLEHHIIKSDERYDYNRDNVPTKVENLSIILTNINKRISELLLHEDYRISLMQKVLKRHKDEEVTYE